MPGKSATPSALTAAADRGASAIGQQNTDLSGSTGSISGVFHTGGHATFANRIDGGVSKYAIRIGSVRLSVGNIASILIALLVVGGGSAAAVTVISNQSGSEQSGQSGRPRRTATDAATEPTGKASGVGNVRPVADQAQLRLSTATVRIGDSYSVAAAGFLPNERVALFWTGRTEGMIGILTAGSDGRVGTQVREGAEPGDYTIRVEGQSSGRTAAAPLRVLPAG